MAEMSGYQPGVPCWVDLSSTDIKASAEFYREIFGSGGLSRYARGANPSLHIIVNNGHVLLTGVVANRMDAQLAAAAATRVPGVFSVQSQLRIESEQ